LTGLFRNPVNQESLLLGEGEISVREKEPGVPLLSKVRFDVKWSGKYKQIKTFPKQRPLLHTKNLPSEQEGVFQGRRFPEKRLLKTRMLFASFRLEAKRKSAGI
jgi:hypothetical protein